MYDILVRDVPAQTLLTEQAHVLATDLPSWIAGALQRLHGAADELGGVIAPSLVIYHGDVSEERDGPVEAAVPVDPSRAATASLPTRIEPAHREVFARITKAEVRYPGILAVYDALESWIATNHSATVGPPREIYFTDFEAAGPNDECVDIACAIAA